MHMTLARNKVRSVFYHTLSLGIKSKAWGKGKGKAENGGNEEVSTNSSVMIKLAKKTCSEIARGMQ